MIDLAVITGILAHNRVAGQFSASAEAAVRTLRAIADRLESTPRYAPQV